MEEGTDEEHHHRGSRLAIAQLEKRQVQVSDAPPVNWHVPGAPEGVDVVGVPPITVKVAISKMQNLAEHIEERVEGQVEEAQPDEVVWDLKEGA